MLSSRLRIAAWAVVCPFLLAGSSQAATYVIPPDRDTYLDEAQPTKNFGDSNDMEAHRLLGDRRHSLVRFPLTGIPGGVEVDRATLVLQVNDADETGFPIEIYRATDSWAEMGATWLNTGSDYDGTVIWGSFKTPVAGDSVTADVTSLVQDWLESKAPNHGFVLIPSSLGEESRYATKEDSDSRYHPRLIIETRILSLGFADLEVNKTVDVKDPREGDPITFYVNVHNLGPDGGTGVRIVDLLPAGLTYSDHSVTQGSYTPGNGLWLIGSIASGDSASLRLGGTVDYGTGGSTLTNWASVSQSSSIDLNPGNDADSAAVVVQSADLAITKDVDDPTPGEGEIVTFSVVVRNEGPNLADSVVVADPLPSGLTYTGSGTTQGFYDDGAGFWYVDSLAAGDSALLALSAIVDSFTVGSLITNWAWVGGSSQPDPDSTDDADSASVTVGGADLEITKTVSNPTPTEGSLIQYSVRLRNLGPDAAGTVAVIDSLPAGVTYLFDSASRGTYIPGTGMWGVGSVAAGDSATLDLYAMVDAGTQGQTITNVAAVVFSDWPDPDDSNDADSVDIDVPIIVPIETSDLSLVKNVDVAIPAEGDTVAYTVVLDNLGPDPATNVAVTDALPAGVTFASAIASQGSYSAQTGVWTIGTVLNGGSKSLTIRATVDSATAGSQITNTAAVTASDQNDLDLSNNSDSADISPTLTPGVALREVAGPATRTEGQAGSSYQVRIENLGFHRITVDSLALTFSRFGPGDLDGAFAVLADPSNPDSILGQSEDWFTFTVDLLPAATPGPVTIGATVAATDSSTAALADSTVDSPLVLTIEAAPSMSGEPGTLTPTSIAPGTSNNYLSVALQNGGDASVTYDGSTHLRITAPGDSLDVPLDSADGAALLRSTLDFGPFSVPGAFPQGTHPLTVYLSGTDSNGWPFSQVLELPDSLLVSGSGVAVTASQIQKTVRPGVTNVNLCTLGIFNAMGTNVTLNGLTLQNTTTGPGSQAQLDAELGAVTLWVDDGDGTFEPLQDSSWGPGSVAGGNVSFAGLSMLMGDGQILGLHVVSDVATSARDSDSLDLRIAGPSAITFDQPVVFFNAFPIDPAGVFPVDGMSAAQIERKDLPTDEAFPGDTGVLALDFVAPANGYTADVLSEIRIVNQGTALNGFDLQNLRLWADGGNGTYDGGSVDDLSLGGLTWTGSEWLAGALGLPVSTAGRRLYVSLDVTPLAVVSRTIQLGIPGPGVTGLVVGSDNDGPVDSLAVSPTTISIRQSISTIEVLLFGQSGETAVPGVLSKETFRFELVNHSAAAETLGTVSLTNSASGPGNQAQLDSDWGDLTLFSASRNDIIPPEELGRAAGATFSGGRATFSNLGIRVAPADTMTVLIRGGASLVARDSDVLDLEIASSTDLVFERTVALTGDAFPLDPAGSFLIDGMSKAQIAVPPVALPDPLTGSVDNLALSIVVPPNGYQTDTLLYLNVANVGTAQPGTDIEGMKAWADDGNGLFDPASDTLLGELFFTGAVWQRSGLSTPIPLTGLPLFLSVDIATGATIGAGVQLALPVAPEPGLGVATSNDGPMDVVLASPRIQTITRADRISFSPAVLGPDVVSPGDPDAPLLQLEANNLYLVTKTLTGLTVTNATTGSGSPSELDGEIAQLHLHLDAITGSPAASAVFANGEAVFTGFSADLTPGVVRDVFVTGDVALLGARDGDVLSTEIADVGALTFADSIAVVVDNFPLSSQAALTVDGMVAAQIALTDAPGGTLGPGEGPALALDFELFANGYASDVLEGLRLENLGTADTSDVAELRLWRDGGDGAFDAGASDDTDLGPFTYLFGEWASPALSDSLVPGGVRFFASITSSPGLTDSTTVRLSIPTSGVTVQSENDGPIDVPVSNGTELVLSTAALLATLEIDPDRSTTGQFLTALMTVKNNGLATIDSIAPSVLNPLGSGVASPVSGPLPVEFSLAPTAESTFVWTFQADSAGTVQYVGSAAGVEQGTGFFRQSLETASNVHQIFLPADSLGLFPVESMPFSISRGQTDVVPLSLTLSNDGPAGTSDVLFLGFDVRVEDEFGAQIVPADLLSRVVVNEGTSVYLEKTSLETAPMAMDLTLTTPVSIPAGGQVTLSLSLDVSDSTTVSTFRLRIVDETWFAAEDGVNGAVIPIALEPGESYPVLSGLARIVGEATQLDVAADSLLNPDRTVGSGQDSVSVLTLDLYNPDADSLAADVRVSSFAISLVDSASSPLVDPELWIDRIRVGTTVQTLVDRAVTAADDSLLTLVLSPLLSVPTETPLRLFLRADVNPAAPIGDFRVQLADSALFDARDANTGAPLPVLYAATPLAGGSVTVEAPADTLMARGFPALPASLPVGESDVCAIRIALRHPGGPITAGVRADSIAVQCRDQLGQPLVPATYVDRVEVQRGGAPIAVVTGLPASGGEFVVPLPGLVLLPGEADTLEVLFDVEVTAPASSFALNVASGGIHAFDDNLDLPVAVVPESGSEYPLTSGLTQLTSPARELTVAFADLMPAVLAADGRTISVATMTLLNPAEATAGDILVGALRLDAADHDLTVQPIGAVASAVHLYDGETLWAQILDLPETEVSARVSGADSLVLAPGAPRELAVRVTLRENATVSSFRLGCHQDGIEVVQPSSPLLAIDVSPDEGQTFPFWTQTGNFSPTSLADSYSNFPNPFAAGRESTSFAFFLPLDGSVSLKLYSARGEEVTTLLDAEPFAAGLHQSETWSGHNRRGGTVVNGVYLAELSVTFADGTSERHLRKVAVVR